MLLSSAYCFSASLPSILAISAFYGLDELIKSSFEKIADSWKKITDAYPKNSDYELSTDPGSPIMVFRSKAGDFQKRMEELIMLKNQLKNAGIAVSICRGTNAERKSKFFPFLRLILKSTMANETVERINNIVISL